MKQVLRDIKMDIESKYPNIEFSFKYLPEHSPKTYCRFTGEKNPHIDCDHVIIKWKGDLSDYDLRKYTGKYLKGVTNPNNGDYEILVNHQNHVKRKVKYIHLIKMDFLENEIN